ncbi:MAG: hypothetical protein Ct9H300mP25_05350 [Acidobacteriota bacterium]|nr:MAG: hypothetical protein Ct9H300mP25_05350 [Acidobacteriota bacterium]
MWRWLWVCLSPKKIGRSLLIYLSPAVAIDIEEEPSNRLLNTLAQQQARLLLRHTDDLFFAPLDEIDQDGSEVDQEIQ